MDATQMTPEHWSQAFTAIGFLGLALLMAIVAAGALALAHAILPSAVSTATLPAGLNKLRPLLYVTGLLALGGLAASLFFFAGNLGFIAEIYPRYL
jgi:hypothetical protein